MTAAAKHWIKPVLILSSVSLLAWLSPKAPIDPWNLFSPKKIATMIFALTFLQVVGSALSQVLGAKVGAILSGFLGGLISSTATTAALAKQSNTSAENASTETLSFLAATGAMLFEAATLILAGTSGIHLSLLIVFVGPILVTGVMLIRHSKDLGKLSFEIENTNFRILPILKLVAFIVSILALSKVLQNFLGQKGLFFFTFLVSLFEIHGSVIANVQLHDMGMISVSQLGSLLTISIAASYFSKLFLIYTIGSKSLKSQTTKSTLLLCIALLVSWSIFAVVNNS